MKQNKHHYKCHQIFGIKNSNEKINFEDLICDIKFDKTG